MKKTQTIKAILGLTQEEIAILLGLSRSQWSMFELGKRDLPVQAMQELASMLAHQQTNKAIPKILQLLQKKEKKQTHQQLEKELQEVVYLKMLLEQKIKVTEKIRSESLAALATVAYLKTKEDSLLKMEALVAIEKRALRQLKKYSEPILTHLQHRQHTLQQQEAWLSQKIKSFTNETPKDFV